MCSQMARPPWGAQQLARWPGTSPVSRPEKLGSRARFQNTAVFLWHSPASEVTKCDWGGRFSLLCMQQILSPLPPFPTAIHKGVFVLCKFKVSSSNGEKLAGDYEEEAEFYWLSDRACGRRQGFRGAGARAADAA